MPIAPPPLQPPAPPLLQPVLFTFTSKLDGRVYEARWDEDKPVLRVSLAGGPQWRTPTESEQVNAIRCFEEGRLSHPRDENPYRRVPAVNSMAWDFGRTFRTSKHF
jgi:hypothetical protein